MMGLRESSLSTSILEKLVRDATEEIYRLHYSAVAEMDDIQKHKTKKYTNNIKEIPLNEQLLRTAEFKRTLQKFARKIQGHLDEDNGEECRKRFICEQLLKSHLKYGFIEEALRNLYSSEKKYKELFESRADVFSHYPYNVYRFEVKNVHCSRIFEKCSGL
ncbi:uncharacterized protein LOC143235983 [Tachypleus tridentatus]|uniref:uncharacterized protein LOC143235983 n=1 Tax=Tachypleus tridentatus TaxID=6853 RepID=UPI003FD60AE4